MRGAGGTDGGAGRFIIGLVMFVAGGYILLESVHVHSGMRWGGAMFSMGGYGVTSGMILVPFIFGVGIIFYNGKNPLGWLLAALSLVALGFGLISSVQFRFSSMSLFSLLTIIVLLVGGAGILLSGLRGRSRGADDDDRRELGGRSDDALSDRSRDAQRDRLSERSRRR
ncbi:MAG: hypothetical protein ACI9U2_003842 [Bradymonadia bacterium]|jgi:hypothetical protein